MSAEVIDFAPHLEKKEQKEMVEDITNMMNKEMSIEDVNYALFLLVDLFLIKYYPDFYWQFDLFINGKLE